MSVAMHPDSTGPLNGEGLLIRAACRTLDVPFNVAATSLHHLQACKAAGPLGDLTLTPTDLAAACIFVACKVEEAVVSPNHLINTVRLLAPSFVPAGTADEQQPDGAAQPPPSPRVLVGDDYYAAKEQLLVAEQYILRLLSFHLVIDHPHKYLLNMCRLLGAPPALVAAAICLLNDSMLLTRLSLRRQPVQLAAAALLVSADAMGHDLGSGRWLAAVGVAQADADDLAAALVDMMQAQAQRAPPQQQQQQQQQQSTT